VEAKPLETKRTPAASTPGHKRSRKGKRPSTSAGTSGSSAAATPSGTTKAPADTATGGSSSSTPAAPSKSPSGSSIPSGSTPPGAQTGRLVNVTSLGGSFTAGGVFYTVKAPTHTPTVGTPWALSIAATRGGKPLDGVIRMDIVHQGSIVAHVVTAKMTGGRYRRSFAWPDQSVGYPLTIKTSVTGGGISQSFLYDVKVRKAGG
jgi:hypothetical protein